MTKDLTEATSASDLIVIDEHDGRELVRDLALGALHGGLAFLRRKAGPARFEEAMSRFGRFGRSNHAPLTTPPPRILGDGAPAPPIVVQPDSKFLDERQLCAELGISPVTATKWRRIAEGPQFIRVGRLIRYPRAALDAWLSERTVGRRTKG